MVLLFELILIEKPQMRKTARVFDECIIFSVLTENNRKKVILLPGFLIPNLPREACPGSERLERASV